MSKQNKPAVHFFSESTRFVLRNNSVVRNWLNKCIISEKRSVGELNYIFCSDRYLRKINKQYLDHDYFTDIITFPASDKNAKEITGDIFISIDRVRDNARTYGVRTNDELLRVMAHGVLHLCGYGDKTEREAKTMREMENKWMRKFGQ